MAGQIADRPPAVALAYVDQVRHHGRECPDAQVAIQKQRGDVRAIDGVVMTFVNITGRRRSGAASEQLGLIIDEGFSEVYVCDGETQRFSNVNSVARTALGYTMDELRRLAPPDIEHTSSPSAYKENIERLSGHLERAAFETNHRRKDGTHYPVEVRLARIADPPLIVTNAREIVRK
jgi:PAS domain S-box-containing protein